MPVSALQIFDFIYGQDLTLVKRNEVYSAAFARLRFSIRQIASRFADADDPLTLETLELIRRLLSEWLTVPVVFESAILDTLSTHFGTPAAVQQRWGADVRSAFELAMEAAEDMVTSDSPMRAQLRAGILQAASQGRLLKVFCHRRARASFDSLFLSNSVLSESTYIHTLADYIQTPPFAVLFKVGPLRAKGWGAAPDAIKSAPRFIELQQYVWTGSRDEADFGYDPIRATRVGDGADDAAEPKESGAVLAITTASWRVEVQAAVDAQVNPDHESTDDLEFFQRVFDRRETREATLVEIDNGQGILYPPFSRVLSFDRNPATRDPINLRIPGETLHPNMWLIAPTLVDSGIGGNATGASPCQRIWKSALLKQVQLDQDTLIRRLRDSGLGIIHLRHAISHWCEPPSSVIHAPQRIRHFQILCNVLGLTGGVRVGRRGEEVPWWQIAWMEIRNSRGEAIQSGFLEREIVREQTLLLLRRMLPQIRVKAGNTSGRFSVPAPSNADVVGTFDFYPVIAVETGFRVSDDELKQFHDLDTVEQWRE